MCFNVSVNGVKLTIQEGDNIEAIKAKFGNDGITIFDGIDKNKNGKIDSDELETLKTNLKKNNYTVELPDDNDTAKKAFNRAIQNMKNRYNESTLKRYFKGENNDLHEIKTKNTLYAIAKNALHEEGLPEDAKSINDRIAQIALINKLPDVNNVPIGTKIRFKLTEEGIRKVHENNNNSALAFGGKVSVTKQAKEKSSEETESTDTTPDYTKMIDEMTTKEEVLDFINNKITTDKNMCIPYDKIIEKFPNDKDIKDNLLKFITFESTVSDKNRLAIIETYMNKESENFSLDKTKLPDGTSVINILQALPLECKNGDAKEYFRAALKEFGKEKLDELVKLKHRNASVVRERIGELVIQHQKDNDFIQKVLELDKSLISFRTLLSIDAKNAAWSAETKEKAFVKVFNQNRIESESRKNFLEQAVNNNWIIEDSRDIYHVDATRYRTDRQKDGLIALEEIPFESWLKGSQIYDQVKALGSGNIRKMLNGEKGEDYDYTEFITKDNVIGIIESFNMRAQKPIIEYLNNKWSPTAKEMNNIPRALLETAKDKGLENSAEYKALEEKIKPFDTYESKDYGRKSTAQEIDKLMENLINKIYNAS